MLNDLPIGTSGLKWVPVEMNVHRLTGADWEVLNWDVVLIEWPRGPGCPNAPIPFGTPRTRLEHPSFDQREIPIPNVRGRYPFARGHG